LRRLRLILVARDIEPLALFLGLYAVAYGVPLFLPPHDTFPLSMVYTMLGQMAPEWLWGLLLLAIGLPQIGSALRDRPGRACRLSHLAATALWTFWALLFGFSTQWRSGLGPTFLVLAAASVLCYLRALPPEPGRGE
jgi:hypothetical protein